MTVSAIRAPRRFAALGASIAMLAAGVAAAPAANAAETIGDIGAPIAAGSAFKVNATGLNDDQQYRLALTQRAAGSTTNVAENNTCAAAVTPSAGTINCEITETSAGEYTLRLFNTTGNQLASKDVTVLKATAPLTANNAPKIIDNAGSNNDAVEFTYVEGVTWALDGTNVTFPTDAAGNVTQTTQRVAVGNTSAGTNVTVTAKAADGYAIAGGEPTYTFFVSGGETTPEPLTITAAQQPVAIDNPGTEQDQVRVTVMDNIRWVTVSGSGEVAPVNVGGATPGTTVTVPVTPRADGTVVLRAEAINGRSFSNGRLAEDFTLSYPNTATPAALDRLGGSDRYATAVEISKKYFTPTGTNTVYVVSGLRQADALSAGPAAADDNAPLLLSYPGSVPSNTMSEIRRLAPNRIVLVGGEGVLDADVAAQLATVAPVTRLAGPNRHATAQAVAGTIGASGTVYIANGNDDSWPDAISGGSAAAASDSPLLLATAADLTEPTRVALAARNVSDVRLVGGRSRLSDSLVTQVKALAPNATVTRYVGGDVGGRDDRYGTNSSIISRVTGVKANADQTPAVTGSEHVFLATGRNWPDALAGVPAAAKANAPLALVDTRCVPQVTSRVLGELPIKAATQLGQAGVLNVGTLTNSCSW